MGVHGRQRALGAPRPDAAEAILGQIEQSQALDAFAQTLGPSLPRVPTGLQGQGYC